MKKSTLFFSLLGLTATAFAQPSANVFQPRFSKHVRAILAQGNNPQQKTTAPKERISSSAIYFIDMSVGTSLVLNDSSRYKYSNGRGSTFDFGNVSIFDTDYLCSFDTAWNYTTDAGAIEFVGIDMAQYDNTQKRTALKKMTNNGTALENESDTRYEYNTAGMLSVEHRLEWGGSKWDSLSRTYYTYNAQGKLTEEKTYDVANKQWEDRTTYHFNASGNQDTVLSEYFDGSSWIAEDREIMVYYPTNKLKTSLSQEMDVAGWKNVSQDSFGHTTGIDYYTFNENKGWDDNTNAWLNSSQHERVFKNGLPDEEIMKNWNSNGNVWENQAKMKWSYNANKNPIKVEMTAAAFPIVMMRANLYYETYFPTGIKETSNNVSIKLYPNPATDKIMVQTPNTTSGIFTIINMAGQVVSQSNRSISNGEVEISLAGMQPGSYRINIQFADGSVATQQLIKQ